MNLSFALFIKLLPNLIEILVFKLLLKSLFKLITKAVLELSILSKYVKNSDSDSKNLTMFSVPNLETMLNPYFLLIANCLLRKIEENLFFTDKAKKSILSILGN